MKTLLELLAVELEAWPEFYGGDYAVCTDLGSYGIGVWFGDGKPWRWSDGQDHGWADIGVVELYVSELPVDHSIAVITRQMWEEARNAL